MQANTAINDSLEGLRRATEAILAAADVPESLQALLDTREQHIHALQSAARRASLTQPQLVKLNSLIETAGRIRQPLALRKELLKQQIDELRASKRAQGRFTPASKRNGQHLNVKL
jgi:hypothetical protein